MDPAPRDQTVPASKGRIFLRRLLSTVVLWALILGALFSGHAFLSNSVFLAIMLLLAVTGLLEFYGLVRARGLVCFRELGLAGGVVLVLGMFLWQLEIIDPARNIGSAGDLEAPVLVLFVLGLMLRQLFARSNPHGLSAVALTLLGLLYVPWLLNFMQKIYFYPGVSGALYIFYFILVTKFSDTGAYLVGSLIGKHKMIPRISPGKTWEGFAGAIVVPVLASLVFAQVAGERLVGMNWMHAVALGALLSGGAVAGDLIESLFKREAGVKDSGNYFPGIGGILDLIDSLLFNAPIMYLYLRHVITP